MNQKLLNVRKFQFLIGRLKTTIAGKTVGDGVKFQFLIGRLKTGSGHAVLTHATEFQFLIGRLKTYTVQKRLFVSSVSIPHR